jgi:hypothetical protein
MERICVKHDWRLNAACDDGKTGRAPDRSRHTPNLERFCGYRALKAAWLLAFWQNQGARQGDGNLPTA